MKVQSRSQIMNGLKKKIPELWMKKSEEWYDDKERSGMIIASGEDKNDYKGIPAFDYYEEASYLAHEGVEEFSEGKSEEERKEAHREIERKPTYESGVQVEIANWLKERGWYSEWNDAGTIVLSKW
jgi:hypothetical protein|tara:strand:+ start:7677 stop:8054 length:378 start_codon:yes stop_codon:yes gene_type:complete